VIDADGSPSGYIAWYNHHSECSRIRAIRPVPKNEKFGVQRMEMLAIYFALADNLRDIRRKTTRHRKKRVVIAVRSDSKSTVEQLLGLSHIRDALMRRIFFAIAKLLSKVRHIIIFDHLKRSYNMAGLLLEQWKMKEGKGEMMDDFNALTAAVMPAALYI
jgi:response regulator RpfG family c-di-GMP phosphodiesterase